MEFETLSVKNAFITLNIISQAQHATIKVRQNKFDYNYTPLRKNTCISVQL